jgi:indolepyruvate ferredoxin oxidoreductase
MLRAIELNGVAVETNTLALAWGRLAAGDPEFVAPHLESPGKRTIAKTLDEIVARRVAFLTDYQDAAYAARYEAMVARVREAERRAHGEGSTALAEAAARSLFKLMAYKDEYEVARLYTEGSFLKRIQHEFEGDVRLTVHLAPPLLARTKPGRTEPQKMTFGSWMLTAFKGLAKLKRLRGTPFDIFSYTAERRTERALIGEYEAMIDAAVARMGEAPREWLLELLNLPQSIRGFGPVKDRAIAAYRQKRAELLAVPEPERPRTAA